MSGREVVPWQSGQVSKIHLTYGIKNVSKLHIITSQTQDIENITGK
jgi:hypothetical protein